MVNLLIFSNYRIGVSEALAEQAREHGWNVFFANTLADAQAIEANEGGIDILFPRLSNRLYQESLKVIEYFSGRGTFIGVTAEGVRYSYDKYLMHLEFERQGIPTPATQLALDNGVVQPPELPFPLIIKPVDESQGTGISLARNREEYDAALAVLKDRYGRCVAQAFVTESAGRDIRAFVIGDEVVAAIERVGSAGSIVSNISKGGTAAVIDLTEGEKALAIRVARAFGAVYAGVDLIRSNTQTLVLEVNLSPGFKIEEITGVPIARLVIDELIKRRELSV